MSLESTVPSSGTPSRASILTGKHSFQNGVLTLTDALADDQATFAGLLKQAGYNTALVGKWHLHNNPKAEDFDFWEAPHRPWMPPPRFYELYNGHTFPEPPTLRDDYSNRCGVLKDNKSEIARHMSWNTDLKVHDPGPNTDRLPRRKEQDHEYEWDRMTPAQLEAWHEAYRARNEYVKNRERYEIPAEYGPGGQF